MIRVYDTLTRQLRDFVPRDPGQVSIYVCGVTPYDEAHLGHARPSVFWDVVRRYLEYRGYRVRLVQNFTDIDDKVIARARELGRNPLDVSREYSRRYLEDMASLGVKPVDHYPRVSEHIPEIVRVIAGLVEKGFAYEAGGDVYFEVKRFPSYGKLSGRSVDELWAGARVEVGEQKRHPEDFALWKAAKPGEPSWPSPWGPGRPGWHIECTAMALHYLGNGFDLHGGGIDLIFPHHENEIAQSEAFTGEEPFVRYWLHNGLITMRQDKMSKSLKNFVTIRALLRQHSPGAIRLFLLSTHYRSPLELPPDYGERLQEAERAHERLLNASRRLREALEFWPKGAAQAAPGAAPPAGPAPAAADATEILRKATTQARDDFQRALDDDFNTPLALASLFELVRASNSALDQIVPDGGREGEVCQALAEALQTMEELGGILGLLEPAGGQAAGGQAAGEDAALV
ncbi:MAG TPA: cysteine--tRNA ligase, partial [Firmicutes bacterium]|nr:cysteine--tRNA ligase [Bacillota bacterium]